MMIVAKVNGKTISSQELACESIILNMKSNEISLQTSRSRALKNLINAELITAAALNEGVSVEENEVDEALVDVLSRFSSEQNYRNQLKKIKLTEEELRDRIQKHVLTAKYLQGKFDCEDEDCEKKLRLFYRKNQELFYTEERVQIGHILIRAECPDAAATALKIRNRIYNKDDFIREAQSNSCCPSFMNEGNLGFITRGQLIKELDKEIFNLKENEISKVVKTDFGYHIFYLIKKEPARKLEFDEIKDFMKKYRKRLYFQVNLEKHYAELRNKAEIEILDQSLI